MAFTETQLTDSYFFSLTTVIVIIYGLNNKIMTAVSAVVPINDLTKFIIIYYVLLTLKFKFILSPRKIIIM